ncbi:bifunctional UDP-N-acetylglucosamine diphosphorylase/glucosamine-1-phosphate N-acetyltransferase GlmU [Pseudaestuariivita sp.]|uniref:bifunctional UDP-N-acetylglucosamine diphosphorylase/glucosamine-1-phosphate N-acetyltransferase GlmU n=1 Tax=Pseudaestuariivita sp. TaxID=2211669 RepID=UPI0040588EA3
MSTATSTALIILAAGQGSRMLSDLPKVLHKVAGAPLLWHAMRAGAALEPARQIVVTGHGGEEVAASAMAYDASAEIVTQSEQLGTGHAVAQAKDLLADFDGDVIVLYGDTPFISPETLACMAKARRSHDIVVLGFEAADPGRYGRLVMQGVTLQKIVEFKDASEAERTITLCNSGVIAAEAKTLFALLEKVSNDNASGEYYLTDVPGLGAAEGLTATAVTCDEAETLGVNTRAQLAEAEAAFQARTRAQMLEDGVTLTAPDTVHFAFDTYVGRDAIIEPNVVFGPGTTIETGATIRAFSHVEGAHVSRGSIVGPYARLRPGAELAEDSRVGNFCEVKNAEIGERAKVNHLSYIGDAEIGARANIGAGTITCNYDGVFKHRTVVGRDAFIGSNTMLVAPVSVGAEAMTGSGSVITQDVEAEALALGRAKQVTKPGLAARLMERLRTLKANQKSAKQEGKV